MPLSSPSFRAPPGPPPPSSSAGPQAAPLLAQNSQGEGRTRTPVTPATLDPAHPPPDDDIPPGVRITKHASRDFAAVIQRWQPMDPVPGEEAEAEGEEEEEAEEVTTPTRARLTTTATTTTTTTTTATTSPVPAATTPGPESPSYMLHTHASVTNMVGDLDSLSRRCARGRRSRRMASVSGQTGLMRLRTAAAPTPSKVAGDVDIGKGSVGEAMSARKERPPATPLCVRSAAPLRVLDDFAPATPTPSGRRSKLRNIESIGTKNPDVHAKYITNIFEAGRTKSSPSRKRKAQANEVSPASSAKRAKHQSPTYSPQASFPAALHGRMAVTPRRRNLYAANTAGGDGVFNLTKLPRAGPTPSVTTPERRRPRLASSPRRARAVRKTSSSAVDALPKFPAGYFFGALEGAVEGLVPFMGVGVCVGQGSSTEASGTVMRKVNRIAEDEDEDKGKEGTEVKEDTAAAQGNVFVQMWGEGLPSHSAKR